MENYTNLQGPTGLEVLFALLLTLATVYVLLLCRAQARRTKAGPGQPVEARPGMFRPANLGERVKSCSPSSIRELWKKHKSSLADWLAPLIVWSVVIWILLAVAGILLGEN